jgi:hypothetical protein
MAVYVVTWNLNNERDNYAQARREFIEHLKTFEHIYDSGLESVWFIESGNTANQISDYLLKKLDKNDCLFVTKLNTSQHQGWLSNGIWSWINERLNK